MDIHYSIDLLARVNSVILPVFIIWGLLDGLLLGRRVYVPLLPYLITPTPRRTLAVFHQIVMLFGKFNLLAIAFMAGFWVRNFYLRDIAFAWNWLLVLCLLCVCIHLAANILRSWRIERGLPVLGALLCVLVLAVLEWGYDIRILSGVSTALFKGAIDGAFWPPVLMGGLASLLFQWSTRKTKQSLYIDSLVPKSLKRKTLNIFQKNTRRDFSNEMIHCEWNLIFRNRQPKSCFIMIIIITIFYAILNVGISIEMNAKNLQEIPIMFLILFPTIYFIIAFDFRSSFYDKLQSIPVSSKMILKTIIIMSHRWTLLVCILLIIVTISSNILYNVLIFPKGIFMIGIILYGMGVINIATLLLSISFPVARKLNIGLLQSNTFNQPSIINPQIICLFVFPIIFCGIPIIVIKFILNLSLFGLWSGLVMCILGAVGLCIQPRLITLFANSLHKKRYFIMKRFRIN